MNSLESPNNLEFVPSPSEEPSFGDVLRAFESEHREPGADAAVEGTVVSITDDSVMLDVGRKTEGILRKDNAILPADLHVGSTLTVNITGRTEEGYYSLSTVKVERPVDLSGLQSVFESKGIVSGRVTEPVKGGLRVDLGVGVPAFLPASRSGVREVAELDKLVGQDIQVRITKLDDSNPDRPDIVIDRRGVLEEETRRAREAAFGQFSEGMVVKATVRNVQDFGAFCELTPGVDGLLHVSDMSWQRVDKASTFLQPGEQVEVKILKIHHQSKKISLGMKQLEADPWTKASQSLQPGQRVQGKVVRLAEFGAFVGLAPGVDGLIHISAMSWTRRIRKPSDVLNVGDLVEAVVLEVNPANKKISLSLRDARGNPWDDVDSRFPQGATVEGAVTSLAPFGAFIDLGEGVEGMIHIGDISREKRLQHPKEMLSPGQTVKAMVLEVDKEKKRIRLGMKQLEPTSADVFISEHQVGDTLSGRIVDVKSHDARVELAEGVHARCKFKEEPPPAAAPEQIAGDVEDYAALLTQRWKMGAGSSGPARKDTVKAGQIRRFRILALDPAAKRIEVELSE